MNYKEVIKEEFIEEYKKQHKIFYSALNSMIFDISFLEACVELQDNELHNDWITIKFLHRNIFENLISKVYRCFLDNSGQDAISLFAYKNNVVKRFLKEEYRKEIIEAVAQISSEFNDFAKRKKELAKNLYAIRRCFVAHRLLITEEEAIVHLKEIKMLVEYGQRLFQTISFEPRDFYSFGEGDGYNFSDEVDYLNRSTRQFIKTSFLSSKYITKIDCAFEDDCDESIRRRICAILDDLNANR